LGQLQADINRFNGEPTDAVPILNTATSILDVIKDGTGKVSGAQSLGLFETIGILGPLGSLYSSVGGVIDSLMGKKKIFEENSLSLVLIEQLELFNTESKKLVDAVTAKLPAIIPTAIASIFSQPILDKLSEGLTKFKAA
jgi:hypothetical protein